MSGRRAGDIQRGTCSDSATSSFASAAGPFDGASLSCRRPAGRPGRPQRRGQVDPVQADPGRAERRWRRNPARAAARVGHVAQEAPGSPTRLADSVLAAGRRAHRAAGAKPRPRPIRQRLAESIDRLDAIDAHTAPARAAAILAGLGFSPKRRPSACRPISRAAGACAWRWPAPCSPGPTCCCSTSRPTISISKPTLWLRDFLRALRRHGDRHQPRPRPAQRGRRAHRASGARQADLYTGVTTVRAGARANSMRTGAPSSPGKSRTQRAEAAGLRRPLPRQGVQGPPGAVPHQDAGKAAGRRSRWSRTSRSASISPIPTRWRRRSLIASTARAGYEPGKPVLQGISLRIDTDDRIALLGANGNGKSTLAKLLAGRLTAASGGQFRSPQAAHRLFRTAPDRRTDLYDTPFDTWRVDADRAARQGTRAARPLRLFARSAPTSGRRACRAAKKRGCCSR